MTGRSQGERTDFVLVSIRGEVKARNEATARPVGTTAPQALRRLRPSRPELPARVVTWELLAADAWANLAWALAELRREGAHDPDTRRAAA